MDLYKLGKIPWEETQLIYHSLALLGREALCLVSPASPYVCIGYHQDLEQEVDLEYCRANDIPIFRREVGGGGRRGLRIPGGAAGRQPGGRRGPRG